MTFELEEVGKPIEFNWGKCPLATASFGHGITTTPLQATALYASISNGGKLINPSFIRIISDMHQQFHYYMIKNIIIF